MNARCLLLALVFALALPLATPAATPVGFVWDSLATGAGEGALRWPVALASADPRELLVADGFESRLILFREDEDGWQQKLVLTLPEAPASLAASSGRYYLSQRGSGGLFVLERDVWEPRRLPLPAGVVAGALAADGAGGVYVHDLSGEQVLQVSAQGNVLTRIPTPGSIVALVARGGGGVLVADPARAEIRPYGIGAALQEARTVPAISGKSAWPVGLANAPSGELYVLDRHLARIVVLDGRGQPVGTASRPGWEPGLLHFPAALTTLPDGRLAVADQGNGRIQIFSRTDTGTR